MILVSKSPRRAELLKQAGFEFKVVHPEWKEVIPSEIKMEDIPVLMAGRKLDSVANRYQGEILISADTIVVLNNEILEKPKSREEAYEMLKKLSGDRHRVISGICIRKGELMHSFNDVSEVEFKELSEDEIEFYIDNYKPYDKAGAYGIQEWIGLIGINRIEGSFYNVMGLPVHKIYDVLKSLITG